MSFEKAIPTTNVKKIYQPPFMCSTDKRRLEIWIGKKTVERRAYFLYKEAN